MTAQAPSLLFSRSALLLPGMLFGAFLALYSLTAAPSVLSGDSAEFQLAALVLGVAHPTTYPLYTLLGHLATRLIPFGDPAWRVTLVSAFCAAAAVALFFVLARRVLGATLPALVSALALGLSAGLWNAATLAEVYALLALLIVGLALALSYEQLPLAAFIAGLGFTHHGLFTITALPLLAAFVGMQLLSQQTSAGAKHSSFLPLPFAFLLGLLPWLYPPLQFARFGPFNGLDYGLPQHYFWGAPGSYAEVFDLMTGGTIRRGIFRLPDPAAAFATLQLVGRRLLFEFGPLGALLGLLGSWALARHNRVAFGAGAWVFFSTLVYLLLLGPAVADAPVFTLPMLLPWALWIGAGAAAVGSLIAQAQQERATRAKNRARHRWFRLQPFAFGLLLALTLAWGATRYRVSAKHHLWLYREFGVATLSALPPNAALLAHWEQGMALQYLRLAEGVRPDVWVDVVEPSDEPWGPRAARRYPNRPVFFVGPPESVAGLPVELVREDEYASLFKLRR
jgi:hypothetical protein